MKILKFVQKIIISTSLLFFSYIIYLSFQSSSTLPHLSSKVSAHESVPTPITSLASPLDSAPILPARDTIPSDILNSDLETISESNIFRGNIAPGDTFDSSLRRSNVPGSIRQKVISLFRPHIDYKRLDTNDKYVVILDDEGQLQRCVYEASPLESFLIEVKDGKANVSKSPINLQKKTMQITGEIQYSLYGAFEQFQNGTNLLYSYADIFSSKIDFNTEARKGDRFLIVVDKFFKDDQFVGYGRIKFAQYAKKNGHTFLGYLYKSEEISGYFDENGHEVGTSFLRSPVPMARVTSRFTYRRKHPITGRIQPHLGIDLAAPVGTPILAAGDGVIEAIGRNGGNGLQIILSHLGGYKTYYGHLSRFKKGLKRGSTVSKKDIIGYVGSSGYSTGPHLDYRISANGIFKDPFSLEFTPKSVLKGKQLKTFDDSKRQIHASLQNSTETTFESTIQVSLITLDPENKLILL